jgi:hypothetical protein
MREITRQWIDYTNARKQALEEAKQREAMATPVSIYSVTRQTAAKLPIYVARPSVPPANINYSVPVRKLRKLAKELGTINMTYREVGLKSFDYAYKELVGDE